MKRYGYELIEGVIADGIAEADLIECEYGGWCKYSDHEAELAKKDEEIANYKYWRETAVKYADKCEAEIARLEKALEECLGRQVKIQDLMRKHNYKVDDLKDPVQMLYFAIYTELCEVDAIAREALAEKE